MRYTKFFFPIAILLICVFISACVKERLSNNENNGNNLAGPLETVDFSINNTENTVALGTLYEQIKSNETEYGLNEIRFTGEMLSNDNEFSYRVYEFIFTDFDMQVSVKTINTNSVYLYDPYLLDEDTSQFEKFPITNITLKTSAFKTHRGITTGSHIDDIIKEYGYGEESREDNKIFISYTLDNMKISFELDNNQIVQKVVLHTNITPETPNIPVTVPDDPESTEPVTTDIIESFFLMKKDEIISCLGEDYEIVETGPDASFEGYYFKRQELIFVFSDDDFVAWITSTKPYEINGAMEGMTFTQIQECLGETEIIEGWYGVPDHTAYSIEYLIGKCKYKFTSVYDINGPAWLTIYWGRSRLSAYYVETLFDMKKDEVKDNFGVWHYYEYTLGEEPELVDTGIDGYMGYYFREWGFTFAFEADDTVSFIIMDESIEINGAGAGMDFAQIKKCLGDSEIIESRHDTQAGSVYSVEYRIENCIYRFEADNPNGDNSILLITKTN